MIEGKTILITGGRGFIASNLARHLAGKNKVILFDNGRRNALDLLRVSSPNIRIVQGDVLDPKSVEKAIEKSQIVVHTAAIAGVSSYYEQPVNTMEVNFIGTANVLRTASNNPALELFVNFSTSEVYGAEALNVSENAPTVQGPVGDSRWTYSLSKIAAEHLCFAYAEKNKLPVVSLRPFNVYGPGQVGVGALNKFCMRAVRNEPLEITGDGTQVRAWCYIDDMINGTLLCLEKPDKAMGNVFNIGNPQASVTTIQLAKKVVQITGSRTKTVFVPHHGTDIQNRIPSIEKAESLLGFTPKTGLDEGIAKTAEWYRKEA